MPPSLPPSLRMYVGLPTKLYRTVSDALVGSYVQYVLNGPVVKSAAEEGSPGRIALPATGFHGFVSASSMVRFDCVWNRDDAERLDVVRSHRYRLCLRI